MTKKFFVIDEKKYLLSDDEREEIEINKTIVHSKVQEEKKKINERLKKSTSNLKHVEGRVIVMADIESKNVHTFQNGVTIRRERDFNDFNRRNTQPTNATVISADNIPAGSEILIHHNALHDSNRIFDYTPIGGEYEATDIRYFSIPENECYAWRDESGKLQPMKNFVFALRVFEPYKGVISGIEPTVTKDVLFIYSDGELCGNVVHCLKASDYQIVFQGENGREENIIRCRHYEDQDHEQEEVIAISHSLTEQVNSGKLLIGLSPTDAKVYKP